MEVLFIPEAAQEFEDAVVYLDEREPGLGGALSLRVGCSYRVDCSKPDYSAFKR